MSQCVHDFKKNPEGEVLCILCGGKDDEMETEPPRTPNANLNRAPPLWIAATVDVPALVRSLKGSF